MRRESYVPELEWQDKATCSEDGKREIFDATGYGDQAAVKAAKLICYLECSVKTECQDYVFSLSKSQDTSDMVMGGLSSTERLKIRKNPDMLTAFKANILKQRKTA